VRHEDVWFSENIAPRILASPQDGVNGQLHVPAVLLPEKESLSDGRVGPGAGWDVSAKNFRRHGMWRRVVWYIVIHVSKNLLFLNMDAALSSEVSVICVVLSIDKGRQIFVAL
jgi:hypothetical protein